MKRYRAEDYWFEIGSAPDATGRVTRCYIVRCRKCGAKESQHATMLPDPAFRRIFTRKGWQIGKNRGQHLCPTCSSPVRKQEPVPARAPLRDVWKQYSYDERGAFIKWLIGDGWQEAISNPQERERFIRWMQYAGWVPAADVALKVEDFVALANMREPEPAPEVKAPTLRLVPVETVKLPPVSIVDDTKESVKLPPVSLAEEEETRKPNEPADWWKELMAKP